MSFSPSHVFMLCTVYVCLCVFIYTFWTGGLVSLWSRAESLPVAEGDSTLKQRSELELMDGVNLSRHNTPSSTVTGLRVSSDEDTSLQIQPGLNLFILPDSKESNKTKSNVIYNNSNEKIYDQGSHYSKTSLLHTERSDTIKFDYNNISSLEPVSTVRKPHSTDLEPTVYDISLNNQERSYTQERSSGQHSASHTEPALGVETLTNHEHYQESTLNQESLPNHEESLPNHQETLLNHEESLLNHENPSNPEPSLSLEPTTNEEPLSTEESSPNHDIIHNEDPSPQQEPPLIQEPSTIKDSTLTNDNLPNIKPSPSQEPLLNHDILSSHQSPPNLHILPNQESFSENELPSKQKHSSTQKPLADQRLPHIGESSSDKDISQNQEDSPKQESLTNQELTPSQELLTNHNSVQNHEPSSNQHIILTNKTKSIQHIMSSTIQEPTLNLEPAPNETPTHKHELSPSPNNSSIQKSRSKYEKAYENDDQIPNQQQSPHKQYSLSQEVLPNTTSLSHRERTSNHDLSKTSDHITNLVTNHTSTIIQREKIKVETHEKHDPHPRDPFPKSGHFTEVIEGVWVYSVFYEPYHWEEKAAHVKGIAIAEEREGRIVITCHVTYENDVMEKTYGYVMAAQDTHKLKYFAAFVHCVLRETSRPRNVSFSSPTKSENSTRNDGHVFQIIHPGKQQMYNATVCYGVLFGGYNDVTSLMQNVEFNRVMGAQHFLVYTQTVGRNVTRVLQFYASRGLMTVLRMPASDVTDLSWYHGQIAAINDCLMRNKGRSRLVSVQDSDEYLMPLTHSSWQQLTDYIDLNLKTASFQILPQDVVGGYVMRRRPYNETASGRIGAYSFQHYYYCVNNDTRLLEFLQDELRLTQTDIVYIYAHGVNLFLKRYRTPELKPYPRMAKTIYRPELTREPGVHFARRLWNSSYSAVIDPDFGILGHLRKPKLWQKFGTCAVFDSSKRPYYKEFLYNFRRIYDEFLEYSNL